MKSLGENTEKYISFSVLTNTANENGEKIVYKLKFIDSMRFVNTSLPVNSSNFTFVIFKHACHTRPGTDTK